MLDGSQVLFQASPSCWLDVSLWELWGPEAPGTGSQAHPSPGQRTTFSGEFLGGGSSKTVEKEHGQTKDKNQKAGAERQTGWVRRVGVEFGGRGNELHHYPESLGCP